MRGADERNGALFSYVNLEDRVRGAASSASHPTDRQYRTRRALRRGGRPSIPPERLLRAALIQILLSIRSECPLMEQMQYNLLFRWFVGLGIDDPVWVPTVFTKNRDRLLTTVMARKFLSAILARRRPVHLHVGWLQSRPIAPIARRMIRPRARSTARAK